MAARVKMHRTSTPGIFKRGSRYIVVFRHRGQQYKNSYRTMAEAREAQGQRRQPGERTPATRAKFEDYATAWLENYTGRTARGFSDAARDDYKRSINNYAIPFFARYRLAEIEPSDVRQFVRSLEARGLRASSVRKNLTPLKAMLATAVEDGALRSNAALAIRVSGDPDAHERKARSLTREELRAVIAATPDEWRPFFTLLAQTGLRISEAIGLRWRDVDLGTTPKLYIREQVYKGQRKRLKTRNSLRDLPLTPQMTATLRAKRASSYVGDDAPVFPSLRGGTLEDHNLRNRVLKPTVEPLGLGWVGFHTFRHTCASLLFDSGKTLPQVAAWLGHADPAFTLRTYVHLLDAGLGHADFLDGAVAPALPDVA